MRERIKKTIEWWVTKKNIKKYVIFPFGNNGRIAKEILNEDFGITELFVVDTNKVNEENNVYDLEFLKKKVLTDDFMVLVSIHMSSKYYMSAHQSLSFLPLERMIDVFSISTYFNPWKYYEAIALTNVKFSIIESISREIYLRGIKGSVAEAGVYKGGTAAYINRLFPDRRLYLFDTFEGFNNDDLYAEDANSRYHISIDFSDTNEQIVMDKMLYPQQCELKKGWFPSTIVEIKEKFCFARLDMDLYDPTMAGLDYFYDNMTEGFILVHDCRNENFEGARNAVIEFCKGKGLSFFVAPDDRGTAVLSINKKLEG